MKSETLDGDIKALSNQIKTLTESIELLTKVTSISVAKEELFKGKKENYEKIKALEPYDLPDKIIAMLIGSTSSSVKSLRYQNKGQPKESKSTDGSALNNKLA